MAVLGIQEGVFLDLGSADGVNSNCANLAFNFGWRGFFVDGNQSNIERGRAFYQSHPDTWAYPPVFVCAMINRENINQLLTEASVPPDVDFMSIDIDGNDYWIWDALSVTTPKVVIIETTIEFGMNNIVVPYDKDHVYPGKHPELFRRFACCDGKACETQGLPPRRSEQVWLQHDLRQRRACTDTTRCFCREHPFTSPQYAARCPIRTD